MGVGKHQTKDQDQDRGVEGASVGSACYAVPTIAGGAESR